jgi:hypothetical protein
MRSFVEILNDEAQSQMARNCFRESVNPYHISSQLDELN